MPERWAERRLLTTSAGRPASRPTTRRLPTTQGSPAGDGQDQAQYAPPPADPADEIEHLAQLHASGALTDEEFTAAKANILGT